MTRLVQLGAFLTSLFLIAVLLSVSGGSSDLRFEFIDTQGARQGQLAIVGMPKGAGAQSSIDGSSYEDDEPSIDVPCDDGDPNEAM